MPHKNYFPAELLSCVVENYLVLSADVFGIQFSLVYRSGIFPNVKVVCIECNLVKENNMKTPFRSAQISGDSIDSASFNSRVKTLFQLSKKCKNLP
jgi:hypothetical protein